MNQPIEANSGTDDTPTGDETPFHCERCAMFDLLRTRGIARVEITYNGSCDDGQIENVTAAAQGDIKVSLDTPEQITIGDDRYDSLRAALEEFAWTIVQHYHEGFHNNDGGYGTFVIQVPEQRIKLEHYDQFVDTTYTGTEL
jgi:hypothetical protein